MSFDDWAFERLNKLTQPKHRPAPLGKWATSFNPNDIGGETMVISANSSPRGTVEMLHKCFPEWWWTEFVEAVLREPIG